MMRDDALDDVEPEARPLPGCLRREMWLEDPRSELRRHSWPAVTDLDADAVALCRGMYAYDAFAVDFRCECIGRVIEQIRPELMQLGAVGLDFGERLIVLPNDSGAGLAQLVAHEREAALERLVNVHRSSAGVRVRLAFHGAHELSNPRRAPTDILEQLPDHCQAREPGHRVADHGRAAALRQLPQLIGGYTTIDER